MDCVDVDEECAKSALAVLDELESAGFRGQRAEALGLISAGLRGAAELGKRFRIAGAEAVAKVSAEDLPADDRAQEGRRKAVPPKLKPEDWASRDISLLVGSLVENVLNSYDAANDDVWMPGGCSAPNEDRQWLVDVARVLYVYRQVHLGGRLLAASEIKGWIARDLPGSGAERQYPYRYLWELTKVSELVSRVCRACNVDNPDSFVAEFILTGTGLFADAVRIESIPGLLPGTEMDCIYVRRGVPADSAFREYEDVLSGRGFRHPNGSGDGTYRLELIGLEELQRGFPSGGPHNRRRAARLAELKLREYSRPEELKRALVNLVGDGDGNGSGTVAFSIKARRSAVDRRARALARRTAKGIVQAERDLDALVRLEDARMKRLHHIRYRNLEDVWLWRRIGLSDLVTPVVYGEDGRMVINCGV